jgi:uncharacterized membrane-anchored protein YjiN (DUF445 family)
VSEHSERWIPKWVDQAIAERIMTGLLSTLQELRDPQHPWRVELAQTVEKFIADLATDAEMYAQGERMKAELLASPLFVEQAKSLWGEIEGGLPSDLSARNHSIAHAFEVGILSAGRWLEQNSDRHKRINRWVRRVMLRLLLPRRAEIGAYVTKVVQRWDNNTLVDRTELLIGKDLQFIRINGTLVGGLVGVLIFIVSQWLAAP